MQLAENVVWDDSTSCSRIILADHLASHRSHVLREYQHVLCGRDGRLARDPWAITQAVQHAERILDDIDCGLRGTQVPVTEEETWQAAAEGATHPGTGVHPAEFMQAATDLFAVVMSVVADQWPAGDALVSQASIAVNHAIMRRTATAVACHGRFLVDMMNRVQTDERHQLARELHDRVGAHLNAAYRQVELHAMDTDRGLAGSGHRIGVIQHELSSAMSDIRGVISGLRFSEPVGLEEALRGFLAATAYSETAQVVVNGDEAWAPPEVRDQAYLVVREALCNAILHSEARTILVQVDIAPYELRARVEDDGTGFDVGTCARADHMGTQAMRERVALLDGVITISSAPGAGTRVEFTVPCGAGPHLRR
ncbi:MAG TPA: histidine kinase [Streptosporangiaceae bacterium]|nr:histidine kinase [Streptosporangiaceae bacterium]